MIRTRPTVQEDQRRPLTHDGAVGYELRAFDVEEETDTLRVDSHGAKSTVSQEWKERDGGATTYYFADMRVRREREQVVVGLLIVG